MIYLDKDLHLFYENGVKLGEVCEDVDGYYYFWPIIQGGYWPAELMKAIFELLELINYEWDKEVNEFLCNSRTL